VAPNLRALVTGGIEAGRLDDGIAVVLEAQRLDAFIANTIV